LKFDFANEAALTAAASAAGASWQAGRLARLCAGLTGDLGVGKTTFVRALLRGLGYTGRVPSPTYTLLEHYEIGLLTVVHLDLYRLADARELEFLGLRDWLALPEVWVLAEWPERGGSFVAALDLKLNFGIGSADARWLAPEPLTGAGRQALDLWFESDLK
jgi:tRNA threonylcarbamoyladenosine biosynthesis protein TsaE